MKLVIEHSPNCCCSNCEIARGSSLEALSYNTEAYVIKAVSVEFSGQTWRVHYRGERKKTHRPRGGVSTIPDSFEGTMPIEGWNKSVEQHRKDGS